MAEGWPHFYQWNNGTIDPGGVSADLDWAYPGVLATLQAGPAQAPAWPLAPGNYFGLITGPAQSHGGYYPADQAWIRLIQQALITKCYVPGVSDPDSAWADGQYGPATRQAVLRFEQAADLPQTGTITAADWVVLLA